jgi:hypothetical protein
MKVGKSKPFYIFLLPTGTNNENLAIDRILFPKSGNFGPYFSWKILPVG